MSVQPINNASSTLAIAHAVGSGTLVLKAGEGSRFGDPTPDRPIRVTAAKRLSLVNGQIAPTSAYTIYLCTARNGDTLSGLTAVEGTSDQAFAKNDPVASLITAGTIEEISDLVSTIDVDLAEINEAVDAAVASVAGKADDASVLHRTGSESAAGVKSFTDGINIGSNLLQIRQNGFAIEFANAFISANVAAYGGAVNGSIRLNVVGLGTTSATTGLYITDANGNPTLAARDDRVVLVGMSTAGTAGARLEAKAKDAASNAAAFYSSDEVTSFVVGPKGELKPPSLADSAAANGSIYYSTTQAKLAFKDSGGTVFPLH